MSFSILPKQSRALYFLEWPLSFTGDICKWGSACVHHAANHLISICTGWHTHFVSRKRLVCSRWKFVYIRFTVQELVLLPLQGCQPDGGSGGMLSSTRQLEVQLCSSFKRENWENHPQACVLWLWNAFVRLWPGVPREVGTWLVWKAADSGGSRALEQLDLSAGSQRCRRRSFQLGRAGFEPARTFSASSPRLLLSVLQLQHGRDCAPFSE